jgi:hypothetical protein
MNKLILCLVVLLSFSLYAQDEDTVPELNAEGVESTPAVTEEAAQETVPAVTEEALSGVTEEAAQETVPAVTEEAAPVATEEAAPVIPVAIETRKNTPISKTELEEKGSFKPTESHWYSTFGFEAMEYLLPFSYSGSKESFSEEQRQLYGGRLGFGGEIYLGAGFMTSTRVEGYYMGTLFESAKTADPELEDETVATIKDAGQIYGADIVQTLSFIWELKTRNPLIDEMTYLTVEPFIEGGIGKAWAFNKKDYSYDTGVVVEEYDQSFNDELTNVKFGGGINFTSRQGFFLSLKVTQNRYDITKRRTKGYFYKDGDASAQVASNPSSDLDPVMVYSLGGGYKF